MSPLAQWLRNAFEAHDHDDFHRALAQVEAVERLAQHRGAQAQGNGEVRQQHTPVRQQHSEVQ